MARDASSSAMKSQESNEQMSVDVDVSKLNAKERRKYLREQARSKEKGAHVVETKTEHEKDDVKIDSCNVARKRQRRGSGLTSSRTIEETKIKAKDSAAKPNSAQKVHLTLFVGQLPFTATSEKIREHFKEAGDIQVRMLTEKKTKKFKGTAFIQVNDNKALGAALSRHHSLMEGRRINVELTANGGGNKSKLRLERLKSLRSKQSEKQIEKTKALIQKKVTDPESKLTQDDVDERMIDFLSWFDYETAKNAVQEFDECLTKTVRNRKAFFMGILKRFRATDGEEPDNHPKQARKRALQSH
uniref:Uncharacterized protein AlNc14C261G9815 n=1 Tax=Albugo laibachii Nc14 TaxID=890382 RepID=F0WCP3_9STRA|nr:conserved hypothetical protein [Albugo laibachii Nc14]CCA24836.1 conserved hypothetical protein [Albugo laibachii Nc14]|eukprot:CCA24836.1 conserved hypothetical protein [Albugo laibachii Nc14]